MARAQAALEFLMTYGWAILVVLAAIGALAYFGVLKPDKFLPEKCTIAPGIDCAGHKIDITKVTLVLRNGLGKDITIDGVTVGSNCNETPLVGGSVRIDNGDKATIIIGDAPGTPCNNGAPEEKFKEDLYLTYTELDVNITKVTSGNIVAKVQP